MGDIDIYTRNRGTRRWTTVDPNRRLVTCDRLSARCPCGAEVTLSGASLPEHREHKGFVRCPYSGRSLKEAQRMEKTMTADFILPGECGYD